MSKEVLSRIQQRLKVVGLTEAMAPKKAGLSDSAIRNVRRALEAGKDAKFSTRTLEALAPVLKTTASWLMEGVGEPDPVADEIARIMARLPEEARDQLLGRARSLELLHPDVGPAPEGSEDPQAEGDAG